MDLPLDSHNSMFSRRFDLFGKPSGLVVDAPYQSLKLMTIDNDHARRSFPRVFRSFEIQTIPAESDDEAFAILADIARSGGPLDAITTDIVHPSKGGIELINLIRKLPDDLVCAGGLRIRHLPIVVYTCCYSERNIELIHRIDPKVQVIHKLSHLDTIGKAIDDAVSEYRASVLDELHRVGLAIVWTGGRFSISSCFLQNEETVKEGKYFAAPAGTLSEAYTRLVLVNERATIVERSIVELEQIINSQSVSEHELQDFFRRHPEFLYRGTYATHWAEPKLKDTKRALKPDFILKPIILPEDPWAWEVLELKRSDVVLTTTHKRHPDFSAAVYHGCAQLRNYGRFFANPENRKRLHRQFGGIVPQPKLALVIGRLDTRNPELVGGLRRSIPDVQILTYDEVLAFRRAEVEGRRWFRHRS